jgi:hypothetical protein
VRDSGPQASGTYILTALHTAHTFGPHAGLMFYKFDFRLSSLVSLPSRLLSLSTLMGPIPVSLSASGSKQSNKAHLPPATLSFFFTPPSFFLHPTPPSQTPTVTHVTHPIPCHRRLWFRFLQNFSALSTQVSLPSAGHCPHSKSTTDVRIVKCHYHLTPIDLFFKPHCRHC